MNYILSYIKLALAVTFTIIYLIIVFPFLFLKPNSFHSFARYWGRTILFFLGIKVEVEGEIPDDDDAYIIAANHSSLLDIPVMLSFVKKDVRIVYKQELEKILLFGWILKFSNYISIDRTNAKKAFESIKRAVDQVQNGASILLFPEGTRNKAGIIAEFKRGAFMLADKANKKIIPIKIIGTNTIRGKSYQITSKTVHIVIGTPTQPPRPFNKPNEAKMIEELRNWMIEAE